MLAALAGAGATPIGPPLLLHDVMEWLERHGTGRDQISAGEVMRLVTVVPASTFVHCLAEAELAALAAGARADAEYVALALARGCPVWSYDLDFGRIRGVRHVRTMSDLSRWLAG